MNNKRKLSEPKPSKPEEGSKPASWQALNATPVATLIEHLCGRLMDYAFSGKADRFRSWCLAHDLAEVVNTVLVHMGNIPQPPIGSEKWRVVRGAAARKRAQR